MFFLFIMDIKLRLEILICHDIYVGKTRELPSAIIDDEKVNYCQG
jgi:hypothetical protein